MASQKTKIFLDSGNPEDTRSVLNILGFLDGQTTNPTLIFQNPIAQGRLARGEKFTKTEIWDFYRSQVEEISKLIPEGSISIEVYVDEQTTEEEILEQALEMNSWIPNAHIKFPITIEGVKAATKALERGLRVNMTLCFTQEQAFAVHSAFRAINDLDAFISPFDGRLDDIGLKGTDLIMNIMKFYKQEECKVKILAASVRDINHFLFYLSIGVDIITAPYKVLKEWGESALQRPQTFPDPDSGLKTIQYQSLPKKVWWEYDLSHELTTAGVKKFAEDWNKLVI